MSVLAYSELLARIAGIQDKDLETPFKILSKNHATPLRIKAIRELAFIQPITIGALLHAMHLPRGGGSYLTIRKFFLALEKDGLLEKKSIGSKTVWLFSERGGELKRFILT